MKKKILLVDDEKDTLLVIGKRIITWGYDLIEASSGKEAISAVKTKNPDIVILDYKLPDIDGIAALKDIRKINKTVPVIMFTAFPDAKSITDSEQLGICAYVPKTNILSPAESSLKAAIHIAEGVKK